MTQLGSFTHFFAKLRHRESLLDSRDSKPSLIKDSSWFRELLPEMILTADFYTLPRLSIFSKVRLWCQTSTDCFKMLRIKSTYISCRSSAEASKLAVILSICILPYTNPTRSTVFKSHLRSFVNLVPNTFVYSINSKC